MDMYSIKELADLYKTNRQTIYKKIRSEEMKQYVIVNESGIKIDKEGLNVLNTIMADSKVADKQVDNSNNNEVSRKLTNDGNIMLISILQSQIDELKRNKQELQREKQKLQFKYDQLINLLINKQQQLEAPKSSIFSIIFKTNKV